jgi:hypothetical protein
MMSRRISAKTLTLCLLALVILLALVGLSLAGVFPALAQDTQQPQVTPDIQVTETPSVEPPTPTDTPIPALTVTHSEPTRITAGQSYTLSVYGTNFTSQTVIRLVGYGLLTTTLINETALTAALPSNIPARQYTINVSDPVRGAMDSPDKLSVVNPPQPTNPPPPTAMPPTETPIPTPIPGQPSLLVRNFSANPTNTPPGGRVALTFEVVNQGTRPAIGVSVSVNSGGSFVPANGQASATLPDIAPGGVTNVTLNVVTAQDASPGPTSIPITLTYFDFSGQSYTSDASLSVSIIELNEAPQMTLARYNLSPNPAQPGQPITITVLVTNTGNLTASQVLLRITGSDNLLLAGGEGDSFPLGDLTPGSSVSVDLPMVVSTTATSGPQSQPFSLTYLQNGDSKESDGSLTIPIEEVVAPAPVMLLKSYDTGDNTLQPGDRFTLTMTLQNVGLADAANLLVTFGTVQASGGDSGGGDSSGSGSGSGGSTGGSSSSTTPSTTFAPLGGGGTVYVGNIAANGGENTVTQDFIVNGGVTSGVYSLPVTLRYQSPGGETAQDTLNASIVVVVPPDLKTILQTPFSDPSNVGDALPFSVQLVNQGANSVKLTHAEVTSENADIYDGADTPLTPLSNGDDTVVNATIAPSAEGPVTVTLTVHYINDLNQEQTLVESYSFQAVMPPPPPPEMTPEPGTGPEVVPTPETPSTQELMGQFIMGLLGLGS